MNMPRGVLSLEYVVIGGIKQWLLLRGRTAGLPVLLWLQGGPGAPRIPEAGHLEELLKLEDHFVVAYWDIRGTGKTFRRTMDPADLTLARLAADTAEMVELLTQRFHSQKIYLAGFSMGAAIALLAAARTPERVYACIGIGTDADMPACEQAGYAFALAEATRRGHRRALRELTAIGPPPHTTMKSFQTRAKWIAEFGGIGRNETFSSFAKKMLWQILVAPHYSLVDVFRAIQGMLFSQRALLSEMVRLKLKDRVSRIDAPVYFFHGRHDQTAPVGQIERYLLELDAPRGKKLVLFEDSAHTVHYDEPDKLRCELLQIVEETKGLPTTGAEGPT